MRACKNALQGDAGQPAAAVARPPEGVDALRATQDGKIDYAEFLRRIMKSGAASYGVYLGGRKAIYTGRMGDFYIENFPGAKP